MLAVVLAARCADRERARVDPRRGRGADGEFKRRVASRGGVSYVGPKGHDLVVGVMPDVGASQPWNPGPPAPVTGDLLFVHSEIRFVRGDGAATAKHEARHPPDFGITGDVK